MTATINGYAGTLDTTTCQAQCTLPTSTLGYDTAACADDTTETACEVQCAIGYSGTATSTCSTPGTFTFGGCAAQCTLPTSTVGYVTTGCANDMTETECEVECAGGYSGTATRTCSTHGAFTFGGCVAQCTLPTSTVGYVTTGCANDMT